MSLYFENVDFFIILFFNFFDSWHIVLFVVKNEETDRLALTARLGFQFFDKMMEHLVVKPLKKLWMHLHSFGLCGSFDPYHIIFFSLS